MEDDGFGRRLITTTSLDPISMLKNSPTILADNIEHQRRSLVNSKLELAVKPAVAGGPRANPDETSGPQGQPQSIDPLANDESGDDNVSLDPATLTLLDMDGHAVDSVTVPDEGTLPSTMARPSLHQSLKSQESQPVSNTR